jgi:glycosyltransferase involved in cell wall biosynthesis
MVKNVGIVQGFVGGGGGIEKTLKGIMEALTENNFNVTLYTFSKPSISLTNIKIKSMIPFHLPFFGIYQRLKESELMDKAKDEDIILQTSGSLAMPKKHKKPIIVYCHNDFSNELEKTTTKYKGIWSWYYNPYHKQIKKSLQKIQENNVLLISNSKFTQESIEKKYNKKSTVIFPPIDLSEFKLTTKKEVSVITISRYSEEKNLDFALEVMENIKIPYQIFGNTNTKSNFIYFQNLLSKTKNFGTNSLINLKKNEDRTSVVEALQRSKVYFHTAPETFGITIIEGIAAGCVPIVPDNSAHRETVPISELRYQPYDRKSAQIKLKKALSGEFDHHTQYLQSSLKQYDKETFKQKIIDFMKNL